MTTTIMRPEVVATIDGDDWKVIANSTARLDANAVPYATATLELPLLPDDVLDTLDPLDDVRVPFEMGEEGTTLRPLDLVLVSRTVDHAAKVVTLDLASDEAILQEYRPLADDATPFGLATSLRGVVNHVLGTITEIPRNLITAPRGTTVTGWQGSTSAGGGSTTLSTLTTPGMNVGGLGIDTFLRVESTAVATYVDIRNAETGIGVLSATGAPVTASAYVRPSSIGGAQGIPFIQFVDAGGSTLSTVTGATHATPSGVWTRISVTGDAPAGAVWARVIFRATGSVVSGSRIDATAFLVEESPRLGPYKDIILTPGTDADVTPYWELTQYIGNPSAVAVLTGWVIGTGLSAIARNAGAGFDGVAGFVRGTTSATLGNIRYDVPIAVRAGQQYTASGYVRQSVAGGVTAVGIQWLNSAGTLLDTTDGATSALGTGWTRLSLSATAPVDATQAKVFYAFAGSASARSFDVDGAMFTDGARLVTYFDGGSVGGGYTYTIGGAAHVSAATRHPVAERDPESLTWEAGTSAWDFLLPLVTSVGFILWCDELRVWRLMEPSERQSDTNITVTPLSAVRATDTVERGNPDVFVTGVIARYQWVDADGISRERKDAAGTPGQVVTVEMPGAYPGAGAAAAILARRNGTGRTQDVEVLWQPEATPGMSATITLPGAPDTQGRIVSVDFDLAAGTMALGTAGLIDVTPGDWAMIDPAANWNDYMTADTDWNDL